MPTTSKSALEQLEELRRQVRDAQDHVAQAKAEQSRAERRIDEAKGPLLAYHAGVAAGEREADPALARKLLAAVREAEAGATIGTRVDGGRTKVYDQVAEARVVGATRMLSEAEQAVPRYIREHREQLAAELTERALEARDGLFAGVEAFGQAVGAWTAIRAAWDQMLPQWGMSPVELPQLPFGLDESPGWRSRPNCTLPMPASLAPRDDEPEAA